MSTLSPKHPSTLRTLAVGVLVIASVTLAVYGQVASFDFLNYDDPQFVALNPQVAGGLRADGLTWAFTTRDMGIWHPLTWISYQIEVELAGGVEARVHHLTNLGLHLGSAVLVFILFWRLTGAAGASLVIALLFSVHPQHVQPVAWIAERKEVLAAFFFLVSLNCYLVALDTPRKPAWYTCALIAFALALLSKPSVAPMPVLLCVVELYHRRLRDGSLPAFDWRFLRGMVLDKIPFLVMSLLVSAVTVYIKKTGNWVQFEESLHLGKRLLLMPIGMVHYLQKLVVPWPNPLWIEAPEGLPVVASLLCSVLLLMLGWTIWRLRRPCPELWLGAAWFVLMWLPVSGIVLVSNYYVADRYTYLPYIGAFCALVFGFRRFAQWLDLPEFALRATAAALIALSASLAFVQTGYWKDSATFFTRETEINPRARAAPLYVAGHRIGLGEYDEALEWIEMGLGRDDTQSVAHVYRGDVLRQLDREGEAILAYRRALDLRHMGSDAYINLALILQQRGRVEEAMQVLEQGRYMLPADLDLMVHLAYVQAFRADRSGEALELYRRVLEAEPDNTHALHGAGVLNLYAGRRELAASQLARALELDPGNEHAREIFERFGLGVGPSRE